MFKRDDMIKEQIEARGIKDPVLLDALQEVPRDRFVSAEFQDLAYEDRPVAIGHGQTISQPYIVAYMIQALDLKDTDRVLEIGTGSGYNAAILSRIVKEVYSVERIRELSQSARITLNELGYKNVYFKVGDGYGGWLEHAPFDAIILTAAPAEVPQELFEQLAEGGRLVAPEGTEAQTLRIYRRQGKKIEHKDLIGVRFVPMLKN